MDFMHIWGQKEAIWNNFFSINWFSRFRKSNSSTFKDLQEPCLKCRVQRHLANRHAMRVSGSDSYASLFLFYSHCVYQYPAPSVIYVNGNENGKWHCQHQDVTAAANCSMQSKRVRQDSPGCCCWHEARQTGQRACCNTISDRHMRRTDSTNGGGGGVVVEH